MMTESLALPRITLVTPSYNQVAFLTETLESVLAQNYPDLEYIVMDGGSTDGSVEILRRFERHFAFWTSSPDAGQADALNRGFARGTGDVFGWLNSDDLLTAGALHAVGMYFAAHPDCEFLTGDGVFMNADITRELYVACGAPFSFPELLRFDEDKYLPQPAVFFSRRALERSGQLDPSLSYAMDLDLWLRMRQVFELHYLPRRLALMRQHAGAKSQHDAQPALEVLHVLKRYWGAVGPGERVQIYWGMRRRMARQACAVGLEQVSKHDTGAAWRALGQAMAGNPFVVFEPEGQSLAVRLFLPNFVTRRLLQKP
jgi:GT2 family glycosyltransferase